MRGNIEQAAVVGRKPAGSASVGGVAVGQSGVVAAQLAVGVGKFAEPLAAGALGQAELRTVVAADCGHRRPGTLRRTASCSGS